MSEIGDERPRFDDERPRFDDECPRYDDECPWYDDECPNSMTTSLYNEWFLVCIKFYSSIAKRNFWILPWVSHVVSFTHLSSFCSLLESASGSSVLFMYSIISKNTESDFSTTHSTYRKRRKPLSTGYPPVHFGTVANPIQSEWENGGIVYKVSVDLGNIYSSLST